MRARDSSGGGVSQAMYTGFLSDGTPRAPSRAGMTVLSRAEISSTMARSYRDAKDERGVDVAFLFTLAAADTNIFLMFLFWRGGRGAVETAG